MVRDLRRYAGQTNLRLIAGGILVVVIVGVGLIYLFYGLEAALFGLLCFGIGLVPLILIWGLLWLLDRAVSRANRD